MKKLKITLSVYDDYMFNDDVSKDEINAYIRQFIADIERALEHVNRGCINNVDYNVVEKIIL